MLRLSKCLISFLLLTLSLYISLASPAPQKAALGSLRKRQEFSPLLVQIDSWLANHAPVAIDHEGSADTGTASGYELPPASDIFGYLANPAAPHRPPPITPVTPHPPATTLTTVPDLPKSPPPESPPPAPDLIVESEQAPEPEPNHSNPESTPSNLEQSTSSTELPSTEAEKRKNLAPVGKLILIALVMAGIITLIFCIYFCMDKRIFGCCRKKKSRRRAKQSQPIDEEKDVIHPTPWPNISPPISVPRPRYAYEQNAALHADAAHSSYDNRVINIAPGFPPNKFSVTSSDYPFMARGSAISSATEPMPLAPNRCSSAPAPLLPPNEFFCLPSVPDLQGYGHSRGKSNPIFGHVIARCIPEIKLRSGEHRKSKSVSGLVYVVDTCGRELPRSGEWSGGPRPNGAF